MSFEVTRLPKRLDNIVSSELEIGLKCEKWKFKVVRNGRRKFSAQRLHELPKEIQSKM